MTAPTVSVSATAEREALPDRFVLVARVAGEESDATAARAILTARYQLLEEAASGLPESLQIRRGRLSTWPEPKRGQQRWHVHRAMTLIGHDVELVGDVLRALTRVPEVQLDGPQWALDRDNPVYAELQADAVRQARERAERYAVALGGTLGRLVELRDPGAGSHFGHDAVAVSASAAEPAYDVDSLDFSPETVTVHASVEATWSLVLPE